MTPRAGQPVACCRPRRRALGRAFTLVEAIASIIVLGAVAAVASGLILQAGDRYAQVTVRARMHTEISIALDRMMRALRSTPAVNSGGVVVPDVSAVTPTSISFGGTVVELSGGDLLLSINGSNPAPLLSDVTDFRVEAFDEDGDALGSTLTGVACHPIRRIQLTVTVERAGVSETLSAEVFLRGMMTGGGV